MVVGGEVDGNNRHRCSLFSVSVFISIFSDEIQTKWNLTIIVFDLFIEKRNFWNLVAKFDKQPVWLPWERGGPYTHLVVKSHQGVLIVTNFKTCLMFPKGLNSLIRVNLIILVNLVNMVIIMNIMMLVSILIFQQRRLVLLADQHRVRKTMVAQQHC